MSFGTLLFSLGQICFALKFEQKALKERGIDTMLEEARENNRETDFEHLRRS